MGDIVSGATSQYRFAMSVAMTSASLALLLAPVGVVGVVAYVVMELRILRVF
jgi:hypothetical protein